jgi:iron complex outermembrane recepter protein
MPLALLMLLILSNLSALSAAAAQQQPTPLPPVIVREAPLPTEAVPDRLRSEEEAREEINRTPGGAAMVGSQEIEESRASNLKDVLDFVPGVMIRPRFGAADESQLSIRGSGLRNNFHLRGVNVLIDGFAYGNADGFSDFESLELLSTKYIEVFRGANALRFGANSLGGAINLVTKTGYDAGLLELRSEVGSFDFFKNHIASGRALGPFDYYVGFADTRLNGYREHSEQSRDRVYSTYGYQLSGGTTLRLDVSYVRNEENLPGSLTLAEFKSDPRQRNPNAAFADEARNYDYLRTAFTVRTPLSEAQALEWALQYNYQDLDHPLSFAIIDNVTNNWGGEMRYLDSTPLLGFRNRFTIGAQYFATRLADLNFANIQGNRGAKTKDQINEAANVGVYAEDQLDAGEDFTVVLGGRGQYAHRRVRDRFQTENDPKRDDSGTADYFSFAPKVGFIWKAMPNMQVYGNASRAYEPPLILELTAPGQINGDLRQLKAQKSWQFEVGTRGQAGPRFAWDVSVYDIELWDEIRNVNIRPFPGAPFTIPRFENIDRSRHTGVEAGADVLVLADISRRIGFGTGGDTLGWRTAYTWSRFVFVDDPVFDGNDLPGAPEHYIRSELRYEHPVGFWMAPDVEWVPTSYVVNSENTARTEAYALFNVRLGYTYKPWNLSTFFEARNLADKQYISAVTVDDANGRFFAPGDGRSFYGGVSWRWR